MDKYTNEALRLQPYIQKGIQSLDDADALEIATVYPDWFSEGHYTVDTKVLFEGVLYKCITEHNAQLSWNPADAPSLWAKVLIPDDGTIPAWEQPNSTNPYRKGDKVTHNGKTWISDVDNNVWEPGFYGWTEVK